MNELTSQLLYAQILSAGKHEKRRKALSNIKKACDLLDAQSVGITITKVGKMCSTMSGGPKPQSIRNAPELVQYVEARINEQSLAVTAPVSSLRPAVQLADDTLAAFKLLEAERDLYKSKFYQLKQLVEGGGVNSYADFIKTGQLTKLAVQAELPHEIKQVLITLFSPEVLRKGNLAIVSGRLICTISNEVLLGVEDFETLRVFSL